MRISSAEKPRTAAKLVRVSSSRSARRCANNSTGRWNPCLIKRESSPSQAGPTRGSKVVSKVVSKVTSDAVCTVVSTVLCKVVLNVFASGTVFGAVASGELRSRRSLRGRWLLTEAACGQRRGALPTKQSMLTNYFHCSPNCRSPLCATKRTEQIQTHQCQCSPACPNNSACCTLAGVLYGPHDVPRQTIRTTRKTCHWPESWHLKDEEGHRDNGEQKQGATCSVEEHSSSSTGRCLSLCPYFAPHVAVACE